MKRNPDEDYKDITEIAEALGFKRASQPGIFFYPNCDLQIDLTSSGKNERDVLTNTLRQVIAANMTEQQKNDHLKWTGSVREFRNGK